VEEEMIDIILALAHHLRLLVPNVAKWIQFHLNQEKVDQYFVVTVSKNKNSLIDLSLSQIENKDTNKKPVEMNFITAGFFVG
jgi:hypothetical protein